AAAVMFTLGVISLVVGGVCSLAGHISAEEVARHLPEDRIFDPPEDSKAGLRHLSLVPKLEWTGLALLITGSTFLLFANAIFVWICLSETGKQRSQLADEHGHTNIADEQGFSNYHEELENKQQEVGFGQQDQNNNAYDHTGSDDFDDYDDDTVSSMAKGKVRFTGVSEKPKSSLRSKIYLSPK
ncbi:unnamed protein product, partial [Notodromas monacha]